MADVKFTVDGKQLTAPAGTLLIEACKSAGIEIPAFCYYPGLSLQAVSFRRSTISASGSRRANSNRSELS